MIDSVQNPPQPPLLDLNVAVPLIGAGEDIILALEMDNTSDRECHASLEYGFRLFSSGHRLIKFPQIQIWSNFVFPCWIFGSL